MKHFHLPNHAGRIAIGVIAFMILIVGSLLIFNIIDTNRAPVDDVTQTEESAVLYFDGSPYKLKPGMEAVLFIGTDKYESDEIKDSSFRNDRQNDFNLLIAIDNENRSYTPILINRDTMTDIQTYSVSGKKSGTVYEQLALAYTYGTGNSDSCINTVSAVSNLLYDVAIDHYAAVTLDAIPLLNDAVGGVTLTMLDDLSSIDPSMTKGAEITLSGAQAEAYVRSRYGLDDSTNQNRMKRQQQYINEWVKLATQKLNDDPSFANDTLVQIDEYLTTDLSLSMFGKLADKLGEYTQNALVEPTGTYSVVDGYVQFATDDKELKSLVLETFYVQAK